MGFMYLVQLRFNNAKRQPRARIIQQLIGMSQPNMATLDFITMSHNHQATTDHPNAHGDILKRPKAGKQACQTWVDPDLKKKYKKSSVLHTKQ